MYFLPKILTQPLKNSSGSHGNKRRNGMQNYPYKVIVQEEPLI